MRRSPAVLELTRLGVDVAQMTGVLPALARMPPIVGPNGKQHAGRAGAIVCLCQADVPPSGQAVSDIFRESFRVRNDRDNDWLGCLSGLHVTEVDHVRANCLAREFARPREHGNTITAGTPMIQ